MFGGTFKWTIENGYLTARDGFANDLWEWDGAAGTWTNRTPSTLPETWPTPRTTSIAYVSSARRAVLFGGQSATGLEGDTWLWDGMSGDWTRPTTTGIQPQPRWGHAIVYDDDRDRVILFGGAVAPPWQGLRDVWEW